ncbi:MAG: Glycosyl transferase, group 1 [Candidatus Gottesmanbacteria bacterium GW2011_GWB1_43_11]|uniref:Glycosyl transferase, group 1 n=1 Tax=Candidatus Gottesmanbacteria bacterium GW2011_GWB1_43_11 TaxID=1618446 RepID=A0A0G1CPT6_9BACT|nr:MAG: Glycosyl transferase, group 1 [Candidatus Gottesmanbacteria bacterium GW2011_GWA2_42_16]KKS56290.1 MAG: Glycosyl transferase, group 1 [Candidatus Gottesmanbacteria bacterium GW2011_GWA1_42_26]KKS82298.1 MAG: Glycosyl transferase, group 1 [Candidatus Gottesmanbacteria bacterium GW2011_GWC1_43_10]KKS87492.1 MAG: Glycosyl transferase, group 1 [Candidatus Gottesmanbacteria bacterium GW2011_GWB1_43_11]OGG10133.1 MAG: hypothetical protein A2699_01140 [Candidatus Gottesmanbacteria bacterium RI
MKIAWLSFYSGKIDRGVEVATAALATRLSQKHEVSVFQAGSAAIPGVNTIQLPVETKWPSDTSQSWWRFFYLDYYSRKISKFTLKFLPFLFKYQYDVVIPTNGGWQIVILRLITWLLKKKLVVAGNAGIGRDDAWQLLWRPDHYIAISPQGYEWATRKSSQVAITYIPYGVDMEKIAKAKPQLISLTKPIVLCVAAFIPLKRIDLLIRAMEKVPEASLLVIGNGPEEQSLRKLGEKLLGKRFLLLTNIRHEELISYYKAAALFSLPSKSSEAFGIVYVEALAAGLPVVATRDKNRTAIIDGAGILVEPEDITAYAEAIKQALKSDLKEQAQTQARKYSWDGITKQYAQLLQKLI